MQKFAESFSQTLFLKFYGNSNADCKHLIEERLSVPLTPTFTFFRKGALLARKSRTRLAIQIHRLFVRPCFRHS